MFARVLLFCSVFLLCACQGESGKKPLKGPPNYLVILVDDLGYMDITPNNPDSFYQTPNLERLAAEGIRFDNGYAANPVCSPSRYALVTGRDPTRVNATDWFHHRNGKHREGRFRRAELLEHLPHSETTLPEALAEAGYGSAFIGKWHLGEDQSYWPENQGFDINIGGYSSGSPRGTKGYFAPYKNPRLTDGEKGEYLTERLTDEAIGLLDSYRQQQQPFLLYLSYYTVHNPLGAPAETVSRYQSKQKQLGLEAQYGNEEQVWPQAKNPRRVRLNQTHPTYAAMVEEMDTNIGRILKHLDATGLADNTVVVFTSDNGGLSTSEGLPTSNLPLRGGKGWIYEGGIRVPFIVRLPDGRFAGTVNSTPVTGMDLMPTLLDMAQVDNQPTMDGTSLTPLLDGAELQQRPLFWHYPHYSNQGGMPASAVRLGDYKLVQRLEDGRVHLYNLATDLEEQNDLAAQRPEKTQQLKQRLYNWYRDVDAQFLTPGADGATPWTPFQQTGDELQ